MKIVFPRDANLVGLLSEKARLQFLMGDETIAYESWREAIDVSPAQVNTYRIVYQSLSNVRLFEKSVEVLEEARVTLEDPEQFQVDLAWLYSLVGEYAKSMQEYVGILAKNDRQLSYVRSRLAVLLNKRMCSTTVFRCRRSGSPGSLKQIL